MYASGPYERVAAFDGPWQQMPAVCYDSRPSNHPPNYQDQSARVATPAASALYLLDPASLPVLDSITPSELGLAQIWRVLPAPDGIHLYITSSTELLRYDLPARDVTARVPKPAMGSLAVTPDGTTLVLSDAGDFFDFRAS